MMRNASKPAHGGIIRCANWTRTRCLNGGSRSDNLGGRFARGPPRQRPLQVVAALHPPDPLILGVGIASQPVSPTLHLAGKPPALAHERQHLPQAAPLARHRCPWLCGTAPDARGRTWLHPRSWPPSTRQQPRCASNLKNNKLKRRTIEQSMQLTENIKSRLMPRKRS